MRAPIARGLPFSVLPVLAACTFCSCGSDEDSEWRGPGGGGGSTADAGNEAAWLDAPQTETIEAQPSDASGESASDAPATEASTDSSNAPDSPAEAAVLAGVLVSIDHGASPARLLAIAASTGAGKEICKLPGTWSGAKLSSLAFGRDGALYAYDSSASLVDVVNPCSCDTFVLGAPSAGVAALTLDEGDNLFGFDPAQDQLIRISTIDGTSKPVGSLGLDISSASAAWSYSQERPYLFDGTTGKLHTVDPVTAKVAMPGVQVQGLSGEVGLEVHPLNGALLACGSENVLLTIDPGTGAVTKIGSGTGHQGACDNLAAPPTKIACLE